MQTYEAANPPVPTLERHLHLVFRDLRVDEINGEALQSLITNSGKAAMRH